LRSWTARPCEVRPPSSSQPCSPLSLLADSSRTLSRAQARRSRSGCSWAGSSSRRRSATSTRSSRRATTSTWSSSTRRTAATSSTSSSAFLSSTRGDTLTLGPLLDPQAAGDHALPQPRGRPGPARRHSARRTRPPVARTRPARAQPARVLVCRARVTCAPCAAGRSVSSTGLARAGMYTLLSLCVLAACCESESARESEERGATRRERESERGEQRACDCGLCTESTPRRPRSSITHTHTSLTPCHRAPPATAARPRPPAAAAPRGPTALPVARRRRFACERVRRSSVSARRLSQARAKEPKRGWTAKLTHLLSTSSCSAATGSCSPCVCGLPWVASLAGSDGPCCCATALACGRAESGRDVSCRSARLAARVGRRAAGGKEGERRTHVLVLGVHGRDFVLEEGVVASRGLGEVGVDRGAVPLTERGGGGARRVRVSSCARRGCSSKTRGSTACLAGTAAPQAREEDARRTCGGTSPSPPRGAARAGAGAARRRGTQSNCRGRTWGAQAGWGAVGGGRRAERPGSGRTTRGLHRLTLENSSRRLRTALCRCTMH